MIRPAEISDLDEIMRVYASARAYMAECGNPTQWAAGYPERALIISDIQKKNCFVIEEKGAVHAVFAFITGEEPTYARIYNGKFLNSAPYGTIHRLASDGKLRDVFKACLAFCLGKINNIRVDTHEKNTPMRRLIEENGFTFCGTVYVRNEARRAYQRTGNDLP